MDRWIDEGVCAKFTVCNLSQTVHNHLSHPSFKDGVRSVNVKSYYELSWVLHKFYFPALRYLTFRRKGEKRPGKKPEK